MPRTQEMSSLKMDDSDLALERAVQQLDVSSDSENDDREDARETLSDTEPLNVHTGGLDQIERLYQNSEQMSQVSVSSEPRSTVSSMAYGEAMVSLKSIMKDDRTFIIFRRFLKEQCITRNLNFWLACEHFRQLPPDNQQGLTEVAKAIYFKFVKTSAPQCVLILDRTRKQIKMVLELHMPLSPDLFSMAQEEIWDIMEKNELRQFLVSDSSADCHIFTNLECFSNAVYTPGMAHPAYGVCGGGSLQNSGSEDSSSITSFSTDSDAGHRSAVYQKLSRPYSSTRNAHSDTEGNWQRRTRVSGPHFSKDKVISLEDFVAHVNDRLLAVQKDREGMKRRAQDICRKQGRSYEEIMAIEWFNLKDFETESSRLDSSSSSDHAHVRPPSAAHSLSPSTLASPTSTPLTEQQQQTSSSSSSSSLPPHAHINSLALREVQDALKDLEITNQVSKKRRSHGPVGSAGHPPQTSSKCSSVLSTASDSGVGADGWPTSGLVTPNDRTHAYVRNHNMITSKLPERDMQAQAAAIALISNSPHPDSLNPRVPPTASAAMAQERERPAQQQRRSHHHHHHHQYGSGAPQATTRGNFPGAYSSDDSSSVFTMTSQSSTSDLFIPRRPHPAYSDSDEPHHYGSAKYHHRRQLTTPKRSHHLHKNSPQAPSPMATEQRLQQQQQQQPSPSSQQQTPPPRSHSRHTGGDTLVVYHLDDFPTPFAKRVSGPSVTLSDFKERVFARKGDYRYFFKSFCEDIAMEIMEEYSENSAILPLIEGKIIGRVEKLA